MTQLADIRMVETQGGFNLRDFGGHRTADGRRVRTGMLFRSGTMTALTADDEAILKATGVRTVCDFRRRTERENEPSHWCEGAAGIDYWVSDHDLSAGVLYEMLRREDASGAALRGAMIDLYGVLPIEHAPSYRAVFHRLAEGRVPILINCSAGKDRTGCCAALILHVLGVPQGTIFADYLATNVAADWKRLLARSQGAVADAYQHRPDVVAPLLAADADYLARMFAALDERYGGVDAYLEAELGIDGAGQERIRAHLLEP